MRTTLFKNQTFLFSGLALNLGIFANISSSSSAELLILTARTRCDVSNAGSWGLVKASFGLICFVEIFSSCGHQKAMALHNYYSKI